MISIAQSALTALLAASGALTSPSDGAFDHIDFYGLRSFDRESIQELIGLQPGASIDVDRESMSEKLRALDGIADAVVIHMSSPSTSIALVGILEEGAPKLELRPEPNGEFSLPESIIQAYELSLEESMNGFHKGISGQDSSEGHALNRYEASRAHQMDMLQFAQDNIDLVRKVLRYSRSSKDRHVAAAVIAYYGDKQSVIGDLSYAITDPDSHVRNNAVRALSVLASWSNRTNIDLILDVDPMPLVAMLESIEWTDRNKSAAFLDSLTVGRQPALLDHLSERAVPALTEMALWHSKGHALFSVRILARLAGLSEEELYRRSEEVGREGYAARATWVAELADRVR